MAPKLVNITKQNSFKIEADATYKIELPKGLSEGQNKEWLKSFIENVFVKEGLALEYEFYSAPANLKNYLYITTVKALKNERNVKGIDSPQEKQKITQSPSNKRTFTGNLRYWGVTLLIGVPFWILGRFLDIWEILTRNKYIAFLSGYLIMEKLAPVIMKHFGTSLPGWIKFYLSLFM